MSLFKATIEGDVTQVEIMLAQDPALARASGPVHSAIWRQESSALQVAVMHGRKDIVDLLLAHGANINERDEKSGFTALLNAIDLPDYAALGLVNLLISRDAKKDIFCYLWLEDDEGLKAYLKENPDSVNAIGPDHATSLCFVYTVERAQLLLEHGADVNARDSERHLTPLGWAEAELEDETDRSEVATLLKEFGATA
jgi:ankyrin repeat protein